MHDLRLAVRALRATPVVSLVAALSLALGIGANTAIFSLVNSLLLRALPVKAPQQLAMITDGTVMSNGTGRRSWTNPIWEQIRDRAAICSTARSRGATQRFNLAAGGETQFVEGLWASGGILRHARRAGDARPHVHASRRHARRRTGWPGRGHQLQLLAAAVRRRGRRDRQAARSSNESRSRSSASPDRTSSAPTSAAPSTSRSRSAPSRWSAARKRALDARSTWWLTVMARLKPGQSIDAGDRGDPRRAAADSRGDDAARLAAVRQGQVPEGAVHARRRPAPAIRRMRQRYERPLLTHPRRRRPGAADRVRQHRQPAARARDGAAPRAERARRARRVALAARAAAAVREPRCSPAAARRLGLLLASWASRLLVRQLSTQTNTVFLDLSLDWRVLAFTIGVTVATALLFGTVPALRASGVAPIDALKEHGRGTSSDSARRPRQRSGRRAGRAVARPGGRRRPVHADVQLAVEPALGLRPRSRAARHHQRAADRRFRRPTARALLRADPPARAARARRRRGGACRSSRR